MDESSFSREPINTGFAQIPHGLWTIDAPKGAIVLLGWLHSHSPEFLERLTLNDCREAMGSSQVAEWLEMLANLDFVKIVKSHVAKRPSQVILLAAAWLNLPRKPVSRNRPTAKADIGLPGKPISARIEEQGEDQVEKIIPAPSVQDVQFDHFWSLYPRKEDKKNARLAFKRAVTAVDFDTIMAGLAVRAKWWEANGTKKQHIKTPTAWLNGERWNDEIEPVVQRAAPLMADIPNEVSEWLRTKYGKHWVTDRWSRLCGAWRVASTMGYGPGELAVRLAVQCRISNKVFDPDREERFALPNVKGVSRFSGGLPTYLGAPKTYAELMDLAHKQGNWLVRP